MPVKLCTPRVDKVVITGSVVLSKLETRVCKKLPVVTECVLHEPFHKERAGTDWPCMNAQRLMPVMTPAISSINRTLRICDIPPLMLLLEDAITWPIGGVSKRVTYGSGGAGDIGEMFFGHSG